MSMAPSPFVSRRAWQMKYHAPVLGDVVDDERMRRSNRVVGCAAFEIRHPLHDGLARAKSEICRAPRAPDLLVQRALDSELPPPFRARARRRIPPESRKDLRCLEIVVLSQLAEGSEEIVATTCGRDWCVRNLWPSFSLARHGCAHRESDEKRSAPDSSAYSRVPVARHVSIGRYGISKSFG